MGRKMLYRASEDMLYGWNPQLAAMDGFEEVDLDEFQASRGSTPPKPEKKTPRRTRKKTEPSSDPVVPDADLEDLLAGIDSGQADD